MTGRSGDILFDADRLRVYPRMAIAAYVAAVIGIVVTSVSMIDFFGKPLGYDFITFWSASHLTLQGDAAAAFDFRRLFAAQQLAVPATTSIFLWHYPPTFQLLAAPLALMPYGLSFFVFVGASLVAYVLTLRPLFRLGDLPPRELTLILLAYPGLFICAFHGQNSLLSAACFAGAMLAHRKGRVWIAGAALGMLAYKPQLGLLIPVALAAAGEWRLFFATGIAAAIFAGVSTLVFGVDLWFVFAKNASLVGEIMEEGMLPWSKMPSAFIFFRHFGVPAQFAYVLQGATALGAAASVALVWRRVGAKPLAWAALVTATLLVPPYTFDYEFAIMGLPLVLLASDMSARGATRAEKIALLFLYIMPIFVAPFAQATHVQIGFPALLLLLAMAVRGAYREASAPKATPFFSTPNQASAASTMATPPATEASARL